MSKRGRSFHGVPVVTGTRRAATLIGWLVPVLLLAQPSHEPPQAVKIWLDNPAVLFDVEQRDEKYSSPDPAADFDRETLRLQSSVETGMKGSVYHPNLLEFRLHGRMGLDSEDSESTAGEDYNNGTSFLRNYSANLMFLREKPYAFQLSADRSTYRRDYDFFSTVEVDSQRYGMSGGYRSDAFPVTFYASHSDETVDDTFQPSVLDEDSAGGSIRHVRTTVDFSELTYRYSRYERQESGDYSLNGSDNTVRFGDVQVLGARGQARLNSNLTWYNLDSSFGPYSSLYLQEWLVNDLTPNLESTCRYDFSRNERDDAQSDNNNGSVGLRHRLYESLTSSLGIRGGKSSDDSDGNSLDKTIYGVNAGEDYTKRLGSWGRLSAGYHVRLDQEQWDSSGSSVSVIGESHTLYDGTVTLLNYPLTDLSSVRVRDSTGTRLYISGLDYILIARGDRVQIQRAFGGAIRNGATVLVDYDSSATSSSTFKTLGDDVSIRLDLFDGQVGLYSRYGRQQYSGDGAPLNQAYDDAVFGVDVHFAWFRAGAEHETYDAADTPYDADRLFQTVIFNPTADSSFNLDCRQTWIRFPEEAKEDEYYQFIGRYQVRVISSLSLRVEGGRQFNRERGDDRDALIFRAGADFTAGKLTLSASYDQQDETYRGEDRDRRTLHLRIRRVFR